MACEIIVVQKSPFTKKLGFWRKMAKIWHKVQENGTKKIRLAKLVAKEKNNLAQTLKSEYSQVPLLDRSAPSMEDVITKEGVTKL